MIPKAIRWLLGVFAILGGVLACSAAQATRPPNIVFILTDDQGYRDLGCQGADGIQTPRIDRMAREGVRLTSIYAMATCSPTRAALLTGRYPARYRIHVPVNNPTGGLPPGETTLAEALKQQGYATGLIGKWHLGLSREMSPVAQGFDYFSGVPLSQIERGPHPTHDSYYRRQWRIQDAAGRDVVEYDPCEELFTQRCTQEAVEFIRRNHERPFFLYLAHPMPHGEIVASPKFAGKSPRGVYGDACQELDWSVGQVLDALTRLGLDQRTVVAYASDNGAQESQEHKPRGSVAHQGQQCAAAGLQVETVGRREPRPVHRSLAGQNSGRPHERRTRRDRRFLPDTARIRWRGACRRTGDRRPRPRAFPAGQDGRLAAADSSLRRLRRTPGRHPSCRQMETCPRTGTL
jgi:arylsulfatase